MITATPIKLIAAGLGLVLSAFAAGAGADLPPRCAVSTDVRTFAQDLSHARSAIADGEKLIIVALGSSSTQGVGASSEAASYPSVLQDELTRLLPGHDIRVVNAGIGGNSAHQMYLRLDSDVLEEGPKLVIWQTGVTDAIHDIGLDRFKRILRKGITKLREAGVDVVLMDHQPLPHSDRYPFYRDYLAALREVAAETATPLFRRYDVLNQLLTDGRLVPDEMFSSDALHRVDGSYFCVGVTLARTIAEKLSPRAAEVAPATR
jgi:acyl-CoA thioesterase-1